MFEELFNFKKSEAEKEVGSSRIVRVAINNLGLEKFSPIPYGSIDDKKDLWNNSEAFYEVKKGIKEAYDSLGSEEPLKNYTIIEIGINSLEDMFKMESEFAMLNMHLMIMPEKCMMLDIKDTILDQNVPFNEKVKLLAISYAIKIYNLMDPQVDDKFVENWRVGSNMKITAKGAVEKYDINLFDKYPITMYKVSEE